MRLVAACKAFFQALKTPKVEEKSEYVQGADHLRLLYLLQHTARFIDFLKEDISRYSDADVGAAARQIHEECSKVLEDLVVIRPLLDVQEGALMNVPKGYDPLEMKLTGKIKGEPPFKGKLLHPGWRAHKLSLPKSVGEQRKEILCPAEVEIE